MFLHPLCTPLTLLPWTPHTCDKTNPSPRLCAKPGAPQNIYYRYLACNSICPLRAPPFVRTGSAEKKSHHDDHGQPYMLMSLSSCWCHCHHDDHCHHVCHHDDIRQWYRTCQWSLCVCVIIVWSLPYMCVIRTCQPISPYTDSSDSTCGYCWGLKACRLGSISASPRPDWADRDAGPFRTLLYSEPLLTSIFASGLQLGLIMVFFWNGEFEQRSSCKLKNVCCVRSLLCQLQVPKGRAFVRWNLRWTNPLRWCPLTWNNDCVVCSVFVGSHVRGFKKLPAPISWPFQETARAAPNESALHLVWSDRESVPSDMASFTTSLHTMLDYSSGVFLFLCENRSWYMSMECMFLLSLAFCIVCIAWFMAGWNVFQQKAVDILLLVVSF